MKNTKNIFFVGLVVAASGLISTPLALLAGLIYGLSFAHPYHADSKKLSAFLLQASIVGLGFGMNLQEVVRAGRSGFAYTAVSITCAMLLGLGIGRLFKVQPIPSLLISVGTAICGGSAIAAVGPVVNAGEEEMAVSLGTVFVLNSVALFLFPVIGYALRLTQSQFGLWSALAIHDTSSVVGATAKYGSEALMIGTTIKLARALWIVPLTIAVAILKKTKSRVQWPWFILLFCLAAVANTYLPWFGWLYPKLSALGKTGLTVTLYLIGTGISRSTLKEVGVRPLLQGILLWAIVAISSLLLIRLGLIAI
ncbi:MAG TPA: putative sulfate exporter family transporter [Candidatus Sulfotelmatobacter sp.]|nr:putative sulfate exporter family transporter [Candidatus Sulfotelmatobacter sp.]